MRPGRASQRTRYLIRIYSSLIRIIVINFLELVILTLLINKFRIYIIKYVIIINLFVYYGIINGCEKLKADDNFFVILIYLIVIKILFIFEMVGWKLFLFH